MLAGAGRKCTKREELQVCFTIQNIRIFYPHLRDNTLFFISTGHGFEINSGKLGMY